jgi:hypothetical protein
LTNNLLAFGAVSVVPYFSRYSGASYQPAINKSNSFMQTNNGLTQHNDFSSYSDAKIGLMYMNNERTFSISGSIGVSRSNYNIYSPFYSPVYSPVLRNIP